MSGSHSTLEDAVAPLIDAVRAGDPNRFRCALAAPSFAAPRLLALYAANLEIARIPLATKEPLLRQMRFQFWRDAAGGRPTVTAHPAAAALDQAATEAGSRPQAAVLLRQMVDAREASEDASFVDAAFFDHTSGALTRLAVILSGAPDAEDVAADIGFAHGAAAALAALAPLAARGVCLVPPVDGAPHNLEALARGEPTAASRAAIQALAAQGLARLDAARLRGKPPRQAIAALTPAWDARRILQAAACLEADLVADLAPRSEFIQRWRPLWLSVLGSRAVTRL